MAKLILSSYRAEGMPGSGSVGIVFDGTHPLPGKVVEIKRAADAAAALELYKQEAAALGKPAAVCMSIARGDRSPPGFKALNRPYYQTVNI